MLNKARNQSKAELVAISSVTATCDAWQLQLRTLLFYQFQRSLSPARPESLDPAAADAIWRICSCRSLFLFLSPSLFTLTFSQALPGGSAATTSRRIIAAILFSLVETKDPTRRRASLILNHNDGHLINEDVEAFSDPVSGGLWQSTSFFESPSRLSLVQLGFGPPTG